MDPLQLQERITELKNSTEWRVEYENKSLIVFKKTAKKVEEEEE